MNLRPSDLLRLLILPLFLLQFSLASADQLRKGRLEFEAAREGSVWVGQELPLNLELWTDGFSFGDQLFVLPEVKGGYLVQPDSTTVKLSENRAGVQWQGLRYTLLLYPQRAGRLEVPAFNVSFSASAGFGSEPARFNFRTQPLLVEALQPPGAEPGSLLVTTSSFSMVGGWSPQLPVEGPAELSVGDAITLSVKRQAKDVPGMVFEPLPAFKIDGLASYPENPQVNDRVNRGTLTGVRTDSVTFVCEREGSYEIPELRFQWWDPDAEVMSERLVPAQKLLVRVNPAYASASPTVSGRGNWLNSWSLVLLVAVIALLLAYPAVKLGRRITAYFQQRRLQREAGEAWAFKQVQAACASGNASAAYNAITLWLSRSGMVRPGTTLVDWALRSGSTKLLAEALALQENVVAGSAGKWSGGKLAKLLKQFRHGADQAADRVDVLHPLNPPPLR